MRLQISWLGCLWHSTCQRRCVDQAGCNSMRRECSYYPSSGGCSKWQHSDRRQEYQIDNGSNASFTERNDTSIISVFSRPFLLLGFLFSMLWTTCIVLFKGHRCEKVILEYHGVSCLPYYIDSVEKNHDSCCTRPHSRTSCFIFVCLFIRFLFHFGFLSWVEQNFKELKHSV